MSLPARIALAALLASPAVAAADSGGALGVSIGRTVDDQTFESSMNKTLSVWGRMRLGGRFSGQLEVQQIESTYGEAKLRSGSVLFLCDLLSQGRLVPVLFFGAGLD